MSQPPAAQPAASGFELVLRIDPSIYDGRFANNGWLQELPKPLTKVTWDNVAIVSPNTAQQIGGTIGGAVKGREHYVPLIDITNQQGQTVRAPLWIMPGQPDGVVTVHLGYGRQAKVGSYSSTGAADDVVGFDAYRIRTSFEPWYTNGVRVTNTGLDHPLATTQLHFNLEDPRFSTNERDIVRTETLEEFLNGQKPKENEEHF